MTRFLKSLFVIALFEVIFVRGAEPFTRFFWSLGFPATVLGVSTYGFAAAVLTLITCLLFRFAMRRPFSQYGVSKTSTETQAEISKAVGRWSAILLLAVNFSLLHYPFAFPRHAAAVLVSVFFGSVILNLLFARTQNIWVTLVVHVLYDLVITVQIYFHASGQARSEWILWILYGIFFLFFLRRGLSLFHPGRPEEKNTEQGTPAILLLGAVMIVLPILLLFVF